MGSEVMEIEEYKRPSKFRQAEIGVSEYPGVGDVAKFTVEYEDK